MELPSVKEYDIYLPLTYNDGSAVEGRKIERIGEMLLDQFGGVTFFPQANQGSWKMGDVVFKDRIVIFRVLTARTVSARRFLAKLKEKLQRDFEQEEILIVEKDAKRL
jgi:hypothetical protein